jgi:adenylate kinase family enzyme
MKIVIIGNSGSGKTWLAKQLANSTKAPLIHLDELFWESDGFEKKRAQEDVSQLIALSLASHSWIVEGVFGSLAADYLHESELLIWLDMDWDLCERRLLLRGSESQQHMGRIQSEAGLKKLTNWASTYHSRNDDCSFQEHQAIFSRFNRLSFHLQHESDVDNFLADFTKNKIN